jgi:hypothetical protein
VAEVLRAEVRPFVPSTARLSSKVVDVSVFGPTPLIRLHLAIDALHLRGHSEMLLSWLKLKDRHWSHPMIADLLGPPDYIQKDQHHTATTPVELWRLARILEAEKSAEYLARKAVLRKKRPVIEAL